MRDNKQKYKMQETVKVMYNYLEKVKRENQRYGIYWKNTGQTIECKM